MYKNWLPKAMDNPSGITLKFRRSIHLSCKISDNLNMEYWKSTNKNRRVSIRVASLYGIYNDFGWSKTHAFWCVAQFPNAYFLEISFLWFIIPLTLFFDKTSHFINISFHQCFFLINLNFLIAWFLDKKSNHGLKFLIFKGIGSYRLITFQKICYWLNDISEKWEIKIIKWIVNIMVSVISGN